jgi:uncharacterized protein YggE
MRDRLRTLFGCAVVGAATLALALGGAAPLRAAEPGVLSVSGSGEVSYPPDVAYLRLGVQVEAEQAAEAQRQVSEVASKILQALSRLGIERRDVQTAELQIGPVYANEPRPSGEPRQTGYVASNVVNVVVRKLDSLGTLVDAGLAGGANRVDGIQFALVDDSKARAEALRLAVLDARAKGSALAEALEQKLGPVRSLREEATLSQPRYEAANMRMMAGQAVGTPTEPGEIRVRGQVLLEYALQ